MNDELLTRLVSLWRWRGKRDYGNPDQRQALRVVRGLMPYRLESPGESPLAMARRHVVQGERHVTRQAQVFEEALAAGMDVERAEVLLATYLEFLRVAREHLKVEEMNAAGCTQGMPPGATLKKFAFACRWSLRGGQKNRGVPPR